MSYIHLTDYEKNAIEIYQKEWYNANQISKKLKRVSSTITREINKYTDIKTWKYNAKLSIKTRKEIRVRANK